MEHGELTEKINLGAERVEFKRRTRTYRRKERRQDLQDGQDS